MICFILSGSLGFAIQTYAASESTIDPNAERHFEKANELYDASDYNGAIAEYEKITRLSPNSRIAQNAQYWIGQSQFKAGRFDAALATFRGLVDEYPTSAIITSTQLMIGRVEQSKEEKALFEAVEKGDIEQLKLLISKGANVNTVRDQNSVTLLHLAAEQGHTEIAAILVDKGADVNARDKWGETPLHLAALADLAELLIDKGADINAKGSWGEVPLHYAARAGHLDVVELLISKGTDVDAANDWGNRPLLAAVRGGHLEVAKVLISKGADVDAGNDWGARPLLAAARGGHLEVAKVLISKGADVDAGSDRGFGPLHAAAARGHLDIIELLLSKGIDINARDGNGNPPLAYAAIVGHLEVAKLLLKRGAYVDSGNKRNLTPLNMAIAGGHQDMVELLLANGAPTWRHGGLDPVGVAMALGSESRHQKEMIRFLIDKGIEHSAVQVAAFFGDTDEVKRYLAAGGDINAQESSWLTLLACAVLGGHKDEAEFLISKGADINRRGAEGKSALHWAVFSCTGRCLVIAPRFSECSLIEEPTQKSGTSVDTQLCSWRHIGITCSWGRKGMRKTWSTWSRSYSPRKPTLTPAATAVSSMTIRAGHLCIGHVGTDSRKWWKCLLPTVRTSTPEAKTAKHPCLWQKVIKVSKKYSASTGPGSNGIDQQTSQLECVESSRQ